MIYGFRNFLAFFSYKYLKNEIFFEKPINIIRDKTRSRFNVTEKKSRITLRILTKSFNENKDH